MKKYILLSSLTLFMILSVGCTGIAYIKGHNFSQPFLNKKLAVRPNSSVVQKLSFRAFTDGYAVVTVAGNGCIHTDGEHLMLWLSRDGKNYLNAANAFSFLGYGGPCGVGEESAFSFRDVIPVVGGESYDYYIIGSKGSAKEISANISIGDMLVELH